jgi:hypothetical protein
MHPVFIERRRWWYLPNDGAEGEGEDSVNMPFDGG